MPAVGEILDENKDNYEIACTKNDPFYEDLLKVSKVVKDFIRKHGLIIYGGTAIDYALRLKGDQIYSDAANDIPDLDFYSPDSVQHAYMLADIFFEMGYEAARAIMATHVTTMRVDIGKNHWVADISYMPAKVFKKIPYIEYDGMRVVDPIVQRADLHSSLTFPYENPPREVVFARWAKDIKRFNKMDKCYPIAISEADMAGGLKKAKFGPKCAQFIFHGFMAYNVYYKAYRAILAKHIAGCKSQADKDAAQQICDESVIPGHLEMRLGGAGPKGPPLGPSKNSGTQYIEALVNEKADFAIFSPEDLGAYKLLAPSTYAPLLPVKNYKSLTGKDGTYENDVCFYIIGNNLLSTHKYNLGGAEITVVSIQFLLVYLLSEYHTRNILGVQNDFNLYLRYYLSTLNMISHVELMYAIDHEESVGGVPEQEEGGPKKDKEDEGPGQINIKDLEGSPSWLFFPNYVTSGRLNVSEAKEVMMARTIANYEKTRPELALPINYNARVFKQKKGEHPAFNYEESPFFNKVGQSLE